MTFFVDLESLLRRDRQLTQLALTLVVVLAGGYVVGGAGLGMSAWDMTRMPRDMEMAMARWSLEYALLAFAMWWVMMIAMMLPAAAPVVLLAAALNRRALPGRAPYGTTACFVAGYLAVWAGFSAAAVVVQWQLSESRLLAPMLHVDSAALAGGLLIAAGVWQRTAVKRACLRHCRSPVALLTRRRRPGGAGALGMGVEHGAYCLGCCWLLMALLFVAGVMNLYWIAALALYVAAERLLPAGERVSRIVGACLLLGGLGLIAMALG
jgi:predicted metal-binding membrane protein